MEARKGDIIPRQAEVELVIDKRIRELHIVGLDKLQSEVVTKVLTDRTEHQQEIVDWVNEVVAPLASKTTDVVSLPSAAPTIYNQAQMATVVQAINEIVTALKDAGIIANP